GSGAVSTMGGWGGSALSWGSGAVSTMGGWGGSALSWVTGAGLTMESGLIGFGLLTAGGALTATGIGAVVVLGVGLLVATDFAFNHGKISKAAAKGFVDFCKGTVGLVSMVAKSAKHQTQHMRLERGHYKSGTSDKFLEEGHEKVFKAIEDAVLSGVVALRVSNHGASQHLDLLKKIEPKGSMFEKVNYAATRAANRIDAPIAAHNNKPHCSRDSQDGLFKVTAPTQHKKMQKELVEEHLKYLKDAKYNLDRVVIEHHGELSPETIGQIKLLRKSLQVEIDATHVTEQALAFDIAETAVLDAIKRVALGGISKDSVKHNLEYARVKVGRLGAKVSEAEENVKQKNKAFKASNMLFAASVESLRQAKEALEQDPKNDDLQKIVVAEKHKNKKATERLATAKENLVSAQDSLSKAQKNMNKSMTEVSKLEQEHAAPTRGDQARATGTKIRQTIAGFTLEEAQAEVDSLSKQHQQLLDNVYEDTLDDEALNKRSEKLDKLSDKIKAAERLVFKLQSPTFLQSFKESVNWNGAKTKAEHSKLEAQHEAVQEQLKTDGGSDVAVTRALQSEARALRMEMRTLACLLEVKGEFEFVHGDESKIDDVMLLDAKDRMIREAKQDIKEVQVKVGAIDEAWNTGNTELYNQLRDPALVLELEHLNKGLNSLEMARKVIASRQEAQATKPEKESQAGFLKGISEALSKWWAKPLFKKSEAAEKGLFDDNDFDTSSTWDPSIDALQYDSDDLDDQQGRFRNTQGWGNKEVGDLVTSDTKPEERKSMFSGLTRLFKHKNQEILQSDPEQPEPKPLTQQEFDQQMVAAETAKEQLVELRDQYGDQTSDAWIEANDKVIEADNQINLLKLQDPTKVQDSELDDSDSYTF
ncbi:MAG: hypothetical protein P1U36_08790, partial [Legionellaceae bacterium]|nr:hypothetical protein [Legionellaceae bacterium]